jgi:UDPglucose 6-dehydrogenase
MNYRVGIIGYGVVGQGVAKLLGDDVVAIYDPAKGYKDFDILKDMNLVVIAVPTPTADDGMSCEAKFVNESCLRLHQIDFKGVVLIKSTTSPSNLKKINQDMPDLRLVFSPEYLGESKYFTFYWKYPDPNDMRTHTWQTFGGNREDTRVCVEIFKRKMSVDVQFFQTDLMTACLAKYIENSFFAMKVTFCNEWADIAKTFGVDWNELRELWLADPRINKNHTLVFEKNRGYAGKCFPKDTKAIIKDADDNGYSADLMKAMDCANDKFRKYNE